MSHPNHMQIRKLIASAVSPALKALTPDGVVDIDTEFEPDYDAYIITVLYDTGDASYLTLPLDTFTKKMTSYRIYRKITRIHDMEMQASL